MPIRTVVWGENVHEKEDATVRGIYPKGMHATIADALNTDADIKATTATLDQPEHGLTEARLAETDVLTWWGHAAHDKVDNAIVDRVAQRVWEGMGLVVLHCGHLSKIFKKLMGTSCMLRWREAAEKERVWIVNPSHPIVAGFTEEYFELPNVEMYGEFFDIPTPDELFTISWFEGGEVFRSGCTWRRGKGKVVYFSPGHETFPTYHDKNVLKVIENAIRWAAPTQKLPELKYGNRKLGWVG